MQTSTDEEQYHSPESCYYGLSLSQQKHLAIWRRGKTKIPKALRKKLWKATEDDYAKLLLHCINNLIHQSEHDVEVRMDRIRVKIEVLFNYRSHFGKGFPRPSRILYYKDYSVGLEFSVDRLLDYLYDIGKCAFTAKELRKQLWAIKLETDRYDFLIDYAADISIAEFFNEVIPNAPLIKDKALKGRRTYRKSGTHMKKKLDNVEEVVENADSEENVGTAT